MRSDLPPLSIDVAGVRHRGSTTIGTLGGYVLAVATAIPDLAVTLTSAYVGQIGGDTAATHLWLAPGRTPALEHDRFQRHPADPPAHARVCLLDHAAQLQELLAELLATTAAIDIPPAALDQAAAVWATPAT